MPNPPATIDAQAIKALTQACPGENPLAGMYQDFAVHTRCLLTGHSHQAWPDCAKQGVLAAYQDAAQHVDDKWNKAMQVAQRVRRGFATRLDDPSGEYVLGQNVHELLTRLFSSLPAYATTNALARRAPILSTSGEFHSMRRQLDRWCEYGINIETVPHDLQAANALISRLESRPPAYFGAVILSVVGFMNGLSVDHLDQLALVATQCETPLILDAYHAVNVIPLSVSNLGLQNAYLLGGGYKYCQLGEGVCFLRVPTQIEARPALTGWFAEFHLRDRIKQGDHTVHYANGAPAFAGSTYDPVSHYRAAAVFDFFDGLGLDVSLLRSISQRQVSRLRQGFEALGRPNAQIALADVVPDEQRAGFLALKTSYAAQLCQDLRQHGVWTDARDEILRLGPAPYLNDAQLDQGIQALDACLSTLS